MTYDKDGWGPWIEHDGRGCPCAGMFVETITRGGVRESHFAECVIVFRGEIIGRLRMNFPSMWVWCQVNPSDQIIRYRIRKPRGMEVLERAVRTEEQDA